MRSRSPVRRALLALLLTALIPALSAAGQSAFPSLSPEVPPSGYMQAALVFSGSDPSDARGKAVLARYAELSRKVSSPSFRALPERERGEAVLTLMYDEVLDRYSLRQTLMDVLFEEGTYNCVSSSVLYACLARDAGLTVHPQMTASHAFCTIEADGVLIDVETTNPFGFNPGEKKYVSADSNRYAVVPARTYRGRTECSFPMLVSLIAQNRASFAGDERRYADAVGYMLSRYRYLSREVGGAEAETALGGFLTSCNNYAVELQRVRQYEPALDWLLMCKAEDPLFWNDTMGTTYASTLNNALAALLNAGNWRDAELLLSRYEPALTQDRRLSFRALVFRTFVLETAQSLPPDESLAFLDEQGKNPLASDSSVAPTMSQLREQAWLRRITELENGGKHLAAVALADDALVEFPRSTRIQKLRKTCLDNYAVSVHNRFADLANAGRYDEALSVLNEGLRNYPSSASLSRDLKTLQGMMR